jgi:hypothetical protein
MVEEIRICPKCGSDHVILEAGGVMGSVWKCNFCEFSGEMFPEKGDLSDEDYEKFKEGLKNGFS